MRTSLQQVILFLAFLSTAHSQTVTTAEFARINYCGSPSDPVDNAANANVLAVCQGLNKKDKDIGGTCVNMSVMLKDREQGLTRPVAVRIGVCYNSKVYLYCVTDHPKNTSNLLLWEYREGTCEPNDTRRGKGNKGKFTKSSGNGDDKSGGGSGSGGGGVVDGLPTAHATSDAHSNDPPDVAYGAPVSVYGTPVGYGD